jgi:hypothetical protein
MANEKLNVALSQLISHGQGSEEYELAAFVLNVVMSAAQREQLAQLVHQGPIYDGDVVSKNARDDLIEWGLASRACVKGQQGYTAANYRGWDVLRAAA